MARSNAIKGNARIRYARDADKYQVVTNGNQLALLGAGAQGDYLDKIVFTVINNANCLAQLQDGAGAPFTILPSPLTNNNSVVVVECGWSCNNNWQLILNNGVAAIASGVW